MDHAQNVLANLSKGKRSLVGVAAQAGQSHVLADREGRHDSTDLAVFRDQHDPLLDPLFDSGVGYLCAVQVNLAARLWMQAAQTFEQLGAPGAHQAINPQDFSSMQGKRDVIDKIPAACSR